MRTLVLLFLLLDFSSPSGNAQNSPIQPDSISHGTINVLLSNEDTLVALTDSMLTTLNPDGTKSPDPSGVKLYKLNDTMICTVAGFYSYPGLNDLGAFFFFIPSLMQTFIRDHKHPEGGPFAFDHVAVDLFETLRFQMTSNLQSYVISHPKLDLSQLQPLEVTVAGLDQDKSIVLTAITLTAVSGPAGIDIQSVVRPHSNDLPDCEKDIAIRLLKGTTPQLGPTQPVVRKMNKTFACEVAGVQTPAELMLNRPEDFPEDEYLRVLVHARRESLPLSTEQLVALAKDLEGRTESSLIENGSHEVGGDLMISVLSREGVIQPPKAAISSNLSFGNALGQLRLVQTLSCSGGHIINANSGAELAVTATDCTQDLDGVLIHDSSFFKSRLKYSNLGPLAFGSTNHVSETSLELTSDVDTSRKDVQKLICDFAWSKVEKDGEQLGNECSLQSTYKQRAPQK